MLYIVMVMQTDLILNQRLHTVRKGFDVAHIMHAFRVIERNKYVLCSQCRRKEPSVIGTSRSIQRGEYRCVYACVRSGAFLHSGENVSEGYPFVREQAASVIIGEPHKKGFLGNIIANVVSQSMVVGQCDFATC